MPQAPTPSRDDAVPPLLRDIGVNVAANVIAASIIYPLAVVADLLPASKLLLACGLVVEMASVAAAYWLLGPPGGRHRRRKLFVDLPIVSWPLMTAWWVLLQEAVPASELSQDVALALAIVLVAAPTGVAYLLRRHLGQQAEAGRAGVEPATDG